MKEFERSRWWAAISFMKTTVDDKVREESQMIMMMTLIKFEMMKSWEDWWNGAAASSSPAIVCGISRAYPMTIFIA